MRRVIVAMVVVVVGSAQVLAGPSIKSSARSWPVAGRCMPVVDRHSPCVTLTANDISNIRKAVLATLDAKTLDKHPEWKGARILAEKAIGEYTLGGYNVEMYVHPDRPGDVVRLTGVESVKHGTVHGYRIYVAKLPRGMWAVIEVEPFAEALPEPWV